MTVMNRFEHFITNIRKQPLTKTERERERKRRKETKDKRTQSHQQLKSKRGVQAIKNLEAVVLFLVA